MYLKIPTNFNGQIARGKILMVFFFCYNFNRGFVYIKKFNGHFHGCEKFNRRFAHAKNLIVVLHMQKI